MMDISRLEKFSKFVEDRRQGICRQICKGFHLPEEDAKDVFQNAVIALYKGIETEMPESLDNYFHGIWTRQALKFLRDNKSMKSIDACEPFLKDDPTGGVSLQKLNAILRAKPTEGIAPQIAESPDRVFDLAQMKEQVKKALDMMAGKCKHLLTQYYLMGYSWTEIALQLDMKNADTAKAAANRCRRRFEEKYRELEIYVKE